KADLRLSLRAADLAPLVRALAAALEVPAAIGGARSGVPADWVVAVARDLRLRRGRSLVIAGETQPAEVQALAHLANVALGNVGRTVSYASPSEARSEDQLASLRHSVEDLTAG